MKSIRLAAWLVVAFLSSLPVAAQATAECKGKVVDGEGKPVVGAVITVTNQVNKALHYTDTTDKRGNFWMPGVLYSQSALIWDMKIEAKGYSPVTAKVVSRTSNKTLQDEYERAMRGRNGVIEVKFSAFGELTVDYTMALGDEPPPAPAAAAAAEPALAAPSVAPKDAAFAQALEKVSQGDVEGSVPLFKAAIEAAPTDPERHETYAKVLGKLGRFGEAEKEAAAAAEMAPQRTEPRVVQADLRAAQGDYKKAKVHLEEARALDPTNVKILERVAHVNTELGDLDGAIEANQAIVAANPQNVEVWLALGDLYNRKKEPAKAEEAFRKVAEIDPANAYKTFFNIGAVIENRPNLSAADNQKVIDAFRKAIEIKSDYGAAHRHLAYALLRTGDMDGARAEFERYLEIEPGAKDAAEIRETLRSLGSAQKPVKKKT